MHLSPSSLTTLDQCALRFRWAHIDKIKPEGSRPPRIFAVGTSVHKGLEAAYAETKRVQRRIEGSELFDVCCDAIEQLDYTPGVKSDAKNIACSYLAGLEIDGTTVVAVELGFQQSIGDVKIKAFLDLVEAPTRNPSEIIEVTDWKASPKLSTKHRAGWQSIIYPILVWQMFQPENVAWNVVAVAADPPVVYRKVRTYQELEVMHNNMKGELGKYMRKATEEPFQPTVGPWCRWCDYQAWCPSWGGQEPPEGAWRP